MKRDVLWMMLTVALSVAVSLLTWLAPTWLETFGFDLDGASGGAERLLSLIVLGVAVLAAVSGVWRVWVRARRYGALG